MSIATIVKFFPPEILRDFMVIKTILRKIFNHKLADYGELKKVEGFEKCFDEIREENFQLAKIIKDDFGVNEIKFVLDLFNRGELTEKNWENTRYLDSIMKRYNDHEEIVTGIVKVYGRGLQHASNRLKNNKKIVMLAINQNPEALEFASSLLKEDENVVRKAISRKGIMLNHASFNLKNCKEIVLLALENDKQSYHYASPTLKTDEEIISKAQIYAFAGDKLLNDREFALSAVRNNPLNLHLTKGLQNDREVVLELVKQNGKAIEFASPSLKRDPEIILAAIKQNGSAALLIPIDTEDFYDEAATGNDLLKNKTFIMEAIENGLTLPELDTFYPRFYWDRKMIIAGLERNGSGYLIIADMFPDDREFLIAAAKGGYRSAYFMVNLEREVYLEMVKRNGSTIKKFPIEMRSDPELTIEATLSDGYYTTYSEELFRKRAELEYSAFLTIH